jgi:type I restriction enzyme R subunit
VDYIFEKGKFTEDELEKAIISLFEQQGYDYVHGDNIHRKFEDILLLDDLRSFISERYASNHLSENEIQKIINRINLIPSAPLWTCQDKCSR